LRHVSIRVINLFKYILNNGDTKKKVVSALKNRYTPRLGFEPNKRYLLEEK